MMVYLKKFKQQLVNWLIENGFIQRKRYSLLRINKPEEEEYHLFKIVKGQIQNSSMCKYMTVDQSVSMYFNNEKEQEARQKSADIGDHVCGECIKYLYWMPKENKNGSKR